MKIAFIGAGQIGGSLLLRARQVFPAAELRVCDRPEVLAAVNSAGVADEVSADFTPLVADADVVIIATPIEATLQLLPLVLDAVAPRAIVLDVGSVKNG